MKTIVTIAALALSGFVPHAAMAQGEPMAVSFIHDDEWQIYLDAFISEDGRVIDTANNSITHSESQGYGLLLAFLAQDRATFERIWSFTSTELLIRDDGLAAWLWEPDARPHVTDINNATDGDILIAYALALAGNAWGDSAKVAQATEIARVLGQSIITQAADLTVILPAQFGFGVDDQPDGPVVNLSYWVFEALPVLAELTPDIPWMEIYADGLALVDRATDEGQLPADWLALGGDDIHPAEGWDAEFSYNNIRVPLYLLRARAEPELLARFTDAFGPDFAPARIDVETGERLEEMPEAGYRLIGAAVACALNGTPVPEELQTLEVYTYYGATLQLLALSHLRHYHNRCLTAGLAETQEPGVEP